MERKCFWRSVNPSFPSGAHIIVSQSGPKYRLRKLKVFTEMRDQKIESALYLCFMIKLAVYYKFRINKLTFCKHSKSLCHWLTTRWADFIGLVLDIHIGQWVAKQSKCRWNNETQYNGEFEDRQERTRNDSDFFDQWSIFIYNNTQSFSIIISFFAS